MRRLCILTLSLLVLITLKSFPVTTQQNSFLVSKFVASQQDESGGFYGPSSLLFLIAATLLIWEKKGYTSLSEKSLFDFLSTVFSIALGLNFSVCLTLAAILLVQSDERAKLGGFQRFSKGHTMEDTRSRETLRA